MIICTRIFSAFTFVYILGIPAETLAGSYKITTTYKFYKIQGNSVGELKRQMRIKGPNSYWGYTRPEYKYLGDCHIDMQITYWLPKWLNKQDAPKSMQKKWDHMYQALKQHEEHHATNYVSRLKEIAAANCKKNLRINRKWNKIDRAYDKKTRHGYTEGVRLF